MRAIAMAIVCLAFFIDRKRVGEELNSKAIRGCGILGICSLITTLCLIVFGL